MSDSSTKSEVGPSNPPDCQTVCQTSNNAGKQSQSNSTGDSRQIWVAGYGRVNKTPNNDAEGQSAPDMETTHQNLAEAQALSLGTVQDTSALIVAITGQRQKG